jgi:hypothetical protein
MVPPKRTHAEMSECASSMEPGRTVATVSIIMKSFGFCRIYGSRSAETARGGGLQHHVSPPLLPLPSSLPQTNKELHEQCTIEQSRSSPNSDNQSGPHSICRRLQRMLSAHLSRIQRRSICGLCERKDSSPSKRLWRIRDVE